MAELSEKNVLVSKISHKLKGLEKEQILEVLDFVEFLKKKKSKKINENLFLDFIISEADHKITLDHVRQELSSIKGNLSDIIIRRREERL